MLESGLYALLIADATVASLLATKLYPLLLPQEVTQPSATYQRISTVTDQTLGSIVSMATVRMQFDTWAKDYATTKQVADSINAVLEGFSGLLPNGVSVANITLDSQFDLFESQSLLFRVSTDYLIQFYR